MLSVADVEKLAWRAHAGQVDRTGAPYIEHVRAVAAGLAPFGTELEMAGLLHDVIEDTDWTGDNLREAGVPDRVVAIITAVTNQPGVPYAEKLRRIARDRDATLVKIADNAHNSHPLRCAQLPTGIRERLGVKYRNAREVLWAAADPADIRTIVTIVNPVLLSELS